jgi:hypothetical protein
MFLIRICLSPFSDLLYDSLLFNKINFDMTRPVRRPANHGCACGVNWRDLMSALLKYEIPATRTSDIISLNFH